jgi:hypothetical protein
MHWLAIWRYMVPNYGWLVLVPQLSKTPPLQNTETK